MDRSGQFGSIHPPVFHPYFLFHSCFLCCTTVSHTVLWKPWARWTVSLVARASFMWIGWGGGLDAVLKMVIRWMFHTESAILLQYAGPMCSVFSMCSALCMFLCDYSCMQSGTSASRELTGLLGTRSCEALTMWVPFTSHTNARNLHSSRRMSSRMRRCCTRR